MIIQGGPLSTEDIILAYCLAASGTILGVSKEVQSTIVVRVC